MNFASARLIILCVWLVVALVICVHAWRKPVRPTWRSGVQYLPIGEGRYIKHHYVYEVKP